VRHSQDEVHTGRMAPRLPVKRINDEDDLKAWLASPGCEEVRGFLARVASATRERSIRGLAPMRRLPEAHGGAEAVVRALSLMKAWTNEFPAREQRMRYGNTAFRDWHARLQENALELTRGILAAASGAGGEGMAEGMADEASAYLAEAFGNATRIDYGTGHELSFVAFLFCLDRAGALGTSAAPADRHNRGPGAECSDRGHEAGDVAAGTATDGCISTPTTGTSVGTAGDGEETALAAVADVIFAEYLEVTRLIQTQYWLEPAGSHGVWGLDDYSFLPFLWGAAQLVRHASPLHSLRPRSVPISVREFGMSDSCRPCARHACTHRPATSS